MLEFQTMASWKTSKENEESIHVRVVLGEEQARKSDDAKYLTFQLPY
jgi:hypothetical protein